eukprot:scaffold6271_cov171-Amphora_coffeaeformis.AAC.8
MELRDRVGRYIREVRNENSWEINDVEMHGDMCLLRKRRDRIIYWRCLLHWENVHTYTDGEHQAPNSKPIRRKLNNGKEANQYQTGTILTATNSDEYRPILTRRVRSNIIKAELGEGKEAYLRQKTRPKYIRRGNRDTNKEHSQQDHFGRDNEDCG